MVCDSIALGLGASTPRSCDRNSEADLTVAVIIIPTVAVAGITLRAEFDGEAGE
jgi:hypothetical protein